MAIKKVTLAKDWTHPVGITMKAGETIKVLPSLHEELLQGGYLAPSKKQVKKISKIK